MSSETPRLTPLDPEYGTQWDDHPTDGPVFREPVGMALADVQPERVEWAWENRAAKGKVAMLDGDPGLGKSTLAIALAAAGSRNLPFPGCDRPSFDRPVSSVVINVEDGTADTIRPRAEAAGADLERVFVYKGARICPDDDQPLPPLFPDQLDVVEQYIEATDAKLMIADPAAAIFGPDINNYQKANQVLTPLAAVAERTGCTVLLVRHLTKQAGRSALMAGLGSVGMIGAARTGLIVGRHPEDEDVRVVAGSKNNLGPTPTSLAFRIEEHRRLGCGVIHWIGETDLTADDLVTPPVDEEGRSALDEAEAFLVGELAEGPQAATRIIERAAEHGIAKRTLDRAKGQLGVAAEKRPGPHGQWEWSLETPQDRQGCQP